MEAKSVVYFNRLADDIDALVAKLQQWGLLVTTFRCPDCGSNLSLSKDSTRCRFRH
jgi:hypothetical protein